MEVLICKYYTYIFLIQEIVKVLLPHWFTIHKISKKIIPQSISTTPVLFSIADKFPFHVPKSNKKITLEFNLASLSKRNLDDHKESYRLEKDDSIIKEGGDDLEKDDDGIGEDMENLRKDDNIIKEGGDDVREDKHVIEEESDELKNNDNLQKKVDIGNYSDLFSYATLKVSTRGWGLVLIGKLQKVDKIWDNPKFPVDIFKKEKCRKDSNKKENNKRESNNNDKNGKNSNGKVKLSPDEKLVIAKRKRKRGKM
jgi:hypothetical protein